MDDFSNKEYFLISECILHSISNLEVSKKNVIGADITGLISDRMKELQKLNEKICQHMVSNNII